MLALGRLTGTPQPSMASTRASRRPRKTCTSRSTRSGGSRSAAMPIRWMPRYWLKSTGALAASRAAMAPELPRAKPSRNPPMWKLLEKLKSSTVRSSAPSRVSGLTASPS